MKKKDQNRKSDKQKILVLGNVQESLPANGNRLVISRFLYLVVILRYNILLSKRLVTVRNAMKKKTKIEKRINKNF